MGLSSTFPFKPNVLLVLIISATVLGFWFVGTAFAEQDVAHDSTGDNVLCTSCHPSASRILVHRQLNVGNINKAACLQCHEPHATVQKNDNKLRQPEKSSCISCHYNYSSFSWKQTGSNVRAVHDPIDKCTSCHRQHELGEKPQLTTPKDALCISCHVDEAQKLSKKYRHQPFAAKQCTSCHNPHFSEQQKLLVSAPKQLCESCHLNREGAMGLAASHPPYKQGQCTACHDPHASDNDKQLVSAPEDLCFNCHVGMVRTLQKAVVHPPFGERKCLSCHSPHASKTAKLIKADTIQQLCYNCHKELKQKFSQQSHHPVGDILKCTSCHEPHGTDFRKLQVAEGNELCFSCHSGKKLFYRNIKHSSMQGVTFTGACLNCHRPHGSAVSPLLLKEEMELCSSCHFQMKFGNGITHPVGANFIDPSKGRRLTCTSTCHDPHGTGNKYSVTKSEDALCLTCHTDKLSR